MDIKNDFVRDETPDQEDEMETMDQIKPKEEIKTVVPKSENSFTTLKKVKQMTLTPSPLRIDEEATEESEEKDDEVNSDDEGTVRGQGREREEV